MAKQGSVLAVVGAQYGSEGKGVIVALIMPPLPGSYESRSTLRHSFVHRDRVEDASHSCGWTNPMPSWFGRGYAGIPDFSAGASESRASRSSHPSGCSSTAGRCVETRVRA